MENIINIDYRVLLALSTIIIPFLLLFLLIKISTKSAKQTKGFYDECKQIAENAKTKEQISQALDFILDKAYYENNKKEGWFMYKLHTSYKDDFAKLIYYLRGKEDSYTSEEVVDLIKKALTGIGNPEHKIKATMNNDNGLLTFYGVDDWIKENL